MSDISDDNLLKNTREYKKLSQIFKDRIEEFIDNLSDSHEIEFNFLLEKTNDSLKYLRDVTNNYENVTENTISIFISNKSIDGFWIIRYILGLSKDSFQAEIFILHGNMPKTYDAQLVKVRNEIEYASEVVNLLNVNFDLLNTILMLKTPPTWEYLFYRLAVAGEGSALKGQHTGSFLENKIERELLKLKIPFETHKPPIINQEGIQEIINKAVDFVIPTAVDPKIIIEAKMYKSSGGSKMSDALGDLDKILIVTNKQKRENRPKIIFVLDGRIWLYRLNDLAKFHLKLQNNEFDGIFQLENLDQMMTMISTILSE